MLPILRILPIGGVLLAVMLVALALSSSGGSRAQLTPNMAPVRGAMLERYEHPEWRQFLMQAAIQRADELNRLRELPDTPVRTEAAPAAPKVAGLPTERSDTDPGADDATGSMAQPPAATIPVDIGESSSVELPVAAPEERPPATRSPQRARSHTGSRVKGPHARHVRALAKRESPPSLNFFELLFGSRQPTQTQGRQQSPPLTQSQQTYPTQQSQQVQTPPVNVIYY